MADIERETTWLVLLYTAFVEDLTKEVLEAVDLESGSTVRLSAIIRSSLRKVDELDDRTERWARRVLAALYVAASRETARSIRSAGLSRRDPQRTRRFAELDNRNLDALLRDETLGFLTTMKAANDQIRRRLRSIRRQASTLRAHQRILDETVARVGNLSSANLKQVQEALVAELLRARDSANVVWRPKLRGLPAGNILRTLSELPHVLLPGRRGNGRLLRIDDYARAVAAVKTRQAETLATRTKLRQHGQSYVQISSQRPLHDDACWLYVGKVFALDEEAADELGVAHVDQLPNGGAPFHPNCFHRESPFFPEKAGKKTLRVAAVKPPSWALGRRWAEVEKEWRKRGGVDSLKSKG